MEPLIQLEGDEDGTEAADQLMKSWGDEDEAGAVEEIIQLGGGGIGRC